jgi:hypothetical protein
MKMTHEPPPSPEAMRTLQALRKAVQQKLEEQRRWGHYYVVWEGDHAVFIGEDAPNAGDSADETGTTDKPADEPRGVCVRMLVD